MTAGGGAQYRLTLAEGSLAAARDDLARGRWRDAALFARAAIEHGAKSILACFMAVPRSHEPAAVLDEALASPGFPAALRQDAAALALQLGGYGLRAHVLLSYGDEEHGVDPWSLVTEDRARTDVSVAEATVALAHRCAGAMT